MLAISRRHVDIVADILDNTPDDLIRPILSDKNISSETPITMLMRDPTSSVKDIEDKTRRIRKIIANHTSEEFVSEYKEVLNESLIKVFKKPLDVMYTMVPLLFI